VKRWWDLIRYAWWSRSLWARTRPEQLYTWLTHLMPKRFRYWVFVMNLAEVTAVNDSRIKGTPVPNLSLDAVLQVHHELFWNRKEFPAWPSPSKTSSPPVDGSLPF